MTAYAEPVGFHGQDEVLTQPFSFSIARALTGVVVTLRGDLEGAASARLARVLADLIDGQGNLAVLIDLREVGHVDGEGPEVLATAAESLERRGGVLRFLLPREETTARPWSGRSLSCDGLGRSTLRATAIPGQVTVAGGER